MARFPSKNHFASWNGTAPLDASSGEQVRHRLSRAGDRRINHVLHVMAIVQLRHDTPGRAYYRRKLAAGKTPMEALRALKRRLSDVVYRQLVADARNTQQPDPALQPAETADTTQAGQAGPGGHPGARTDSSADDLATPMAVSSDKSLPGPATTNATPDHPATDLPAVLLMRRALAGAGSGLPLIAPARARRGSGVQGAVPGPARPRRDRTASPSATASAALDAGGAGPYARGAGDPTRSGPTRTGAAKPPPIKALKPATSSVQAGKPAPSTP